MSQPNDQSPPSCNNGGANAPTLTSRQWAQWAASTAPFRCKTPGYSLLPATNWQLEFDLLATLRRSGEPYRLAPPCCFLR